MKPGDTTFIRLEGFQPEWRQAAVISLGPGGKLLLAVRAEADELELQTYSSFELASERGKFILVEGDTKRIRSSCPFPYKSLEVEGKKLLTNARVLEEQESVTFATASEDLPEKEARGKASLKPLDVGSQSESSEESGESDEGIAGLLRRAERLQRDKGISSEQREGKKKKKDRYPLLENKGASQQLALPRSSLDDLLPRVAAAGSPHNVDLNALIQLEVLKELRGRSRSKKSRQEEEDGQSMSSRDSSSSMEGERLRGAGKALRAYRRARRHKRRNPLKYVKRYIKDVEDQLGVTDQSAYKLIDFTKRLQWGKFKTLMRFHYALSEILQELLRGKADQASLQVTQLLRATHQAALDNGEWKTAWLLLDMPDPVEKPRFGGEVQDLETVAAYVKAMHDLEKKSKAWGPQKPQEDEEGNPKGKGKKGRAKGSKGEKTEDKGEN
eukprot:Skav233444  [mRNA]  locus=scaffold1486:342746:344071:- [translate_table: standard]